MSKEHSQFTYRSPKIKQFMGFSYIAISSVIFYFREHNPAPSAFVDKALIAAIIIIGGLGVFQCLSYSVCLFDSHQPRALKRSYFFGLYESTSQFEFDAVRAFPNYNLTGLWGVYLTLSDESLQKQFSEEEQALMAKAQLDAPGLVAIDSIKQEKAEAIVKELKEFYKIEDEPTTTKPHSL